MIYTIIDKKIASCLKPLYAYVYLGLCLHTDFKENRSSINQDTLARFLKVDVGTVQRALKECETNGLLDIHKDQYGWREKNRYMLKRENWFGVYNKILDEIKEDPELPKDRKITREDIGFLLLLKSVCWNHKNYTEYYGEQLADVFVLKGSMIDNYLRKLEKNSYIQRDKKKHRITILRDDLFVNTTESELEVVKGVYSYLMSDNDYIDENGKYHFVN